MIFAKGSLNRPAIKEEMILVVAVNECSSNELVTYGVNVLVMPEAYARINWMNHILTCYQHFDSKEKARPLLSCRDTHRMYAATRCFLSQT